MRVLTGFGLLICCCGGLTACAAAPSQGPDATVTRPAVGRPPAPASAQAALSSEAFTPYAGLGASTDDGLAPGATYAALHVACMNAAGFGQFASSTPFSARENRGLTFGQPSGPWGYFPAALAAQDGFDSADDAGGQPFAPPPLAGLPAAAAAAAGKCFNIVADFNNAQFTTSLAGIETMNNDISTDVIQDPAVKAATTAWSSCMAGNGYSEPDPGALALQEQVAIGLRVLGPGPAPVPAPSPAPAAIRAQIAAAVTDAACTQVADLAGIYFAVQASYEKQLTDANQQELSAEVRQYKAAFAKELSKLPALLRTAPTAPGFVSRSSAS